MTTRIPSRGSDQFNLRLPEGMRDRIAEVAKANGRSMNSEIVARLESSFDAPAGADLSPVISEMMRVLDHLNDTLATDPKVRREFEEAMRRRG
jgi:hypothetical protein